MTEERHPLLAAGAGQAERRLTDTDVVAYCDTLGDRLGYLAGVLERERQEGRLSAAATKAALAFLHEIRATMMVMALKHGRQLLGVEPVPLTIDPTESGMPTLKDFWSLQEDRDRAAGQLAQIPDRAALVSDALETIFGGKRPVKQQILWLQRAYMERLAATPVVTDFRQMPAVQLGDGGSGRLFAVSWTNIVGSVNLFECTTLQFVERGGWHVTGGAGDLSKLVESMAGGRHSLQELIGLAGAAAWIVPQAVERVTIGPYYHRFTQNDALIARVFEAANGGEPFMLRAGIERAVATRAAARSTMDSLLGREPMEAGPSVRHRVLLAPLAIKQALGDADEDGRPAFVYGISKSGDLVC
jgi:hypothetical protein